MWWQLHKSASFPGSGMEEVTAPLPVKGRRSRSTLLFHRKRLLGMFSEPRLQMRKYRQHIWVYTQFSSAVRSRRVGRTESFAGTHAGTYPHTAMGFAAHQLTSVPRSSYLSCPAGLHNEWKSHESPWEQQNLALRYWSPSIYVSFNHLSFLVNSLGPFLFWLILFLSSLFSSPWIIEFAQTKDGNLSVSLIKSM